MIMILQQRKIFCQPKRKLSDLVQPREDHLYNAFYQQGMTSFAQKTLIEQAAIDTHLSTEQVKRWIKKKSYLRRHRKQNGPNILVNKPQITPWQLFLKEYGDSEAGKKEMKKSISKFNKAASQQYKSLNESEKKRLDNLTSELKSKGEQKELSFKEIKKAAAKIFKTIENKFKELEKIGYDVVAFGFFDNDVQAVYTYKMACCVTPKIIEYIRAVSIAGNPSPVSDISTTAPTELPPSPPKGKGSKISSHSKMKRSIKESSPVTQPLPLPEQPLNESSCSESLSTCITLPQQLTDPTSQTQLATLYQQNLH